MHCNVRREFFINQAPRPHANRTAPSLRRPMREPNRNTWCLLISCTPHVIPRIPMVTQSVRCHSVQYATLMPTSVYTITSQHTKRFVHVENTSWDTCSINTNTLYIITQFNNSQINQTHRGRLFRTALSVFRTEPDTQFSEPNRTRLPNRTEPNNQYSKPNGSTPSGLREPLE